MPIPALPAPRRLGLAESIPWDVITFRRDLADGSRVEVTIDRSRLARTIGRKAAANASQVTSSLSGAIKAIVVIPDNDREGEDYACSVAKRLIESA